MRKALATLAIIVLLLSVGCASTGQLMPSGADRDFVQNWYSVLYSEALTVDATMTTLGALYRAGKLSEANKDKAVAAHVQFKMAFNDAVSKLILYYNAPTDLSRSVANSACINVQVQTAAIAAINILTRSGE